eukprot:gene9508-biopygen8054
MMLNRMQVKIARVFIDEADTISTCTVAMDAGFHWYVTSDTNSLMHGSRANSYIVNNTFRANVMSSHHSRLHEPTGLFIRNEDAFVLRSLEFPVANIANVTCMFPSNPPGSSSYYFPNKSFKEHSLNMRVLAEMESGKGIDNALRIIPSSQHESDELGALKRLLTSSIPGVVKRAETRTAIITSNPEETASCSICYDDIGSRIYGNTATSCSDCLGELSIPYAFLRGNSDIIRNTINRFCSGIVRVLLASPTHFGSGLNMEMVSDIIFMHPPHQSLVTRVIERALRVGRTSQLRVWNMCYEGDILDWYTQYPSVTPGKVAAIIDAADS